MVFGDHIQRNLTGARETFEELTSKYGMARSQFYLGFMYAAGLSVESSQAKALTYFTFSALGSNNYAQMALGKYCILFLGVFNFLNIFLNQPSSKAIDIGSQSMWIRTAK